MLRVTVERMESLGVSFGFGARDVLCLAFDRAQSTIKAEFYDLSDRNVIASINAAAQRPVTVEIHVEAHPSRYNQKSGGLEKDERAIARLQRQLDPRVHLVVEDNPDVLLHGKAAVVDNQRAFIATANPTWIGFKSDGEVLVTTDDPADVNAVSASIDGVATSGDHVVAGPAATLRVNLQHLMQSSADLRVATEDLSDPQVVNALLTRRAEGHHDRILLDTNPSTNQCAADHRLQQAGVDVRVPVAGYMHEKFIDSGDDMYVGSANLTYNGIKKAKEIGIVASAAAFGSGAGEMRARFDAMWSEAQPVSC